MADAWTKQVIENGPQNYRAIYTLVFTAMTPLTGYVAADPTSTGDMGVTIAGNTLYPGTHLKIWGLDYDMSSSQALQIIWDATTPQNAFVINGQGSGQHHWHKQGGLAVPQNAGAPITGATGKIIFTTLGVPAVGDMLSVNMWLRKDIHQ